MFENCSLNNNTVYTKSLKLVLILLKMQLNRSFRLKDGYLLNTHLIIIFFLLVTNA